MPNRTLYCLTKTRNRYSSTDTLSKKHSLNTNYNKNELFSSQSYNNNILFYHAYKLAS